MSIEAAIEKLYAEKYGEYVRMYKARASTNDVEDLIQEAFYRALKYKKSYDRGLPLDRWLSRIIDNCLRDLRREQRDGKAMHNIDDHQVEAPETDSDTIETVKAELGKLSGSAKESCSLYFLKGHSPKEIVQITDIPYKTVETSVGRFKKKLRGVLCD